MLSLTSFKDIVPEHLLLSRLGTLMMRNAKFLAPLDSGASLGRPHPTPIEGAPFPFWDFINRACR